MSCERTQIYPENENKFYYQNILFIQNITPEIINEIRNFDVRDDDIWISTYPRSGTVWMRHLVEAVCDEGDFEKIRKMTLHWIEFGTELPADVKINLEILKKINSPRIINCHLPIELFPKQAFQKGKIVKVIRNPKDALVSCYHLHRSIKMFKEPLFAGSWEEFFDYYMENKVNLGSWFNHNLGWWEQRHQLLNMMIFKYEDMKKDLKGSVIKLAEFLGKKLSEETVNNIVKQLSFGEMKGLFKQTFEKDRDLKIDSNEQPFMRKGQIGDWKNYFTAHQNEVFDALYQEKMKNTGLQMEFL